MLMLMSSAAFHSGEKLEKLVLNQLAKNSKIIHNKNYSNEMTCITVPQYIYKDIFTDKARVDFLHVNKEGQRFFIECKNQKVPGSVDTKFPYYIFNMQQNMYKNSKFIFVLNSSGIRKGVLEWLISQTSLYGFYIVSSEKIQELRNIFLQKNTGYVFI